jgi:hypothetical protein
MRAADSTISAAIHTLKRRVGFRLWLLNNGNSMGTASALNRFDKVIVWVYVVLYGCKETIREND